MLIVCIRHISVLNYFFLPFRSSKVLKMEAYDAAVLSYALATAAGKAKPPQLPSSQSKTYNNEDVSLTPPPLPETTDQHVKLYNVLYKLEEALANGVAVKLSQLLEICSNRQVILNEFLKGRDNLIYFVCFLSATPAPFRFLRIFKVNLNRRVS